MEHCWQTMVLKLRTVESVAVVIGDRTVTVTLPITLRKILSMAITNSCAAEREMSRTKDHLFQTRNTPNIRFCYRLVTSPRPRTIDAVAAPQCTPKSKEPKRGTSRRVHSTFLQAYSHNRARQGILGDFSKSKKRFFDLSTLNSRVIWARLFKRKMKRDLNTTYHVPPCTVCTSFLKNTRWPQCRCIALRLHRPKLLNV